MNFILAWRKTIQLQKTSDNLYEPAIALSTGWYQNLINLISWAEYEENLTQ